MESALGSRPGQALEAHSVAAWWLGFLFLAPVRRLWEHPARLLSPWIAPGDRVVEVGCGMGYFTLDLARLVGPRGRVVAIDVEERVLAVLRRRLRWSGMASRVELRRGGPSDPHVDDLEGSVDLAVAAHVLHEAADARRMLAHLVRALRPGGKLFLSEPRGHVTPALFARERDLARGAGLLEVASPRIRRTMAVVLEKPAAK